MMSYRVIEIENLTQRERRVAIFWNKAEALEYAEEFLEDDFTSFRIDEERVIETSDLYDELVGTLREIASDWSDRNMTGLARSDARQRIAADALAKIEMTL
jgi:hypothetical protein